MDIGTLVGCIIGGILLFCAATIGGPEGFAAFCSLSAFLIVFGGSAAAMLIAFPLKSLRKALGAAKKCLFQPKNNPQITIDQIVTFAENVRRGGLLAQESRLDEIRDPFLAEGLLMVVDGLQPATVGNILNSEIEAMQYRHQQNRNIVQQCGKYAPAFGMIGTLIGLVLMLTRLDAETVGPGMAVAILTTLYGVIAANLVFMPIAEKLRQHHDAEMLNKTLIVCGVLAIQAGEHPRIIRLKLQTFLPPNERQEEGRIMASDAQTISMPMPMEEHEEAGIKAA